MAHTRCTSSTKRPRTLRGSRALLQLQLAFGLLVAAGCGPTPQEGFEAPAKFQAQAAGGITLEYPDAVQLDAIRVLASDGALIREMPTAGPHRQFFVPIVWKPGALYRIEVVAGGRSQTTQWQAPHERSSITATLEAPAGQDPVVLGARETVSVLAGSERQVTAALGIENHTQALSEFEWTIQANPEVRLSFADQAWSQHGDVWSTTGALPLEHQNWHETVRIDLPADRSQAELIFQVGPRGAPPAPFVSRTIRMKIAVASPVELHQLVSVGSLAFPTDAQGEVQPERAVDEVALANPIWSTLLGWLRPADNVADQYAAYGWQSLPVTNHSPYPLNLSVESSVKAPGGNEPLLGFAPPAWKAPRESAVAEHLLRLAPGETARAVLPFYVRDGVVPGDYERSIRVRLVGAAAPLAELSAPLVVSSGDPIGSVVVLASIGSVAITWCLAPWAWPRILRRLSVDSLTTIALMSGAHFLVAYASRLGADVVAAVAGPFAVFLAGIGNEGLTSALVAALLVLVPRVGVLALSSLTVFLLQAMFTGQLGFVDLLMVTVSILVQEALLYLLGITRPVQRLAAVRERCTPSYAARMALAIGLGNAIALYAQFCLVTALYRLYFATWYIAAVALVTGLIYGGIGAASGAALGFQLRRTAR